MAENKSASDKNKASGISGVASIATPGIKSSVTSKSISGSAPGAAPGGIAGRATLHKAGAGSYAMQMKKHDQDPQNAEPEVPIEQGVFEIPGMMAVKVPPIFSTFIEKVAPRFAIPDTSRRIIEAFSSVDVNAERVSSVLKHNQYYENLFFEVVASLSKREELPSLEGAVVLVGMQNFRNLITSLQMMRSVFGKHPERGKDGKLKVTPNELVKYAIKCEEFSQVAEKNNSDIAYAAGLIFDIFILVANDLIQDSAERKKIIAYIDQIYLHGMRTAQVALEVGKLMPDFGYKKFLFSACLIHDIGKIVVALLNNEYLTFVEDNRKHSWSREMRQFLEKEKFGINHTIMGGIIAYYFHMFNILEKVIYFHHEPFLLKANKNLYPLTALLCFSTNVANNFKKIDKTDDPIIQLWKGPELRDFNIDMKRTIQVITKNVQI